ncbi:MAG: peptidylprolyl isomerase [Acidobacteria bacterium]|nr:peptidylprolyl isomerase [Acidobacteriota bacterium]
MLDPTHPDANRQGPDSYRVAFDTTKGRFVVEVHRDWAPLGADRFYNLVSTGYYNGNKFFRVVDGFVVQFGMNGDPAINEAWDMASIADDPQGEMNTRGRLTFAHGGPNTRTTQLFINLGDNLNLDNMGFPPFGEIIEGMDVVQSLYSEYGDGPPYGTGPDQTFIGEEGDAYFDRQYPLLDHVETAAVIAER